MKTFLRGLIAAITFALIASPPAGAANPLCNHSYAMLIQGALPSTTHATGVAPFPGALSHAVGIGEITFGPASGTTCAPISGELIFNAGDIQTSPNAEFFGPAYCYFSDSYFGSGLPCFDGGNHFGALGGDSPTTLSNPGPFGNGSQELVFDADYFWLDGDTVNFGASAPFAFTLQSATGGTVVYGTSVVAPGAPILSLTMERILVFPVPTTAGVAPYVGNRVFSCSTYGANQTDLFYFAQNSSGYAGGFGSGVGAQEIFPQSATNTPACLAGGSVSWNINDYLVSSGTSPSNTDCAYSMTPSSCLPTGDAYNPQPNGPAGPPPIVASQFADGTSNSVTTLTGGSDCSDASISGLGYVNSAVVWGPGDTSVYLTTSGLHAGVFGFFPGGYEGICTGSPAPTGTLRVGLLPGLELIPQPYPGNRSAAIVLTNGTPVDCIVSGALTLTNGAGARCTATLTNSSADVQGNQTLNVASTFGINCACTSGPPPVGNTEIDTYDVTLTSSNCAIANLPPTFTCRN